LRIDITTIIIIVTIVIIIIIIIIDIGTIIIIIISVVVLANGSSSGKLALRMGDRASLCRSLLFHLITLSLSLSSRAVVGTRTKRINQGW
jgi:hypothetical protein